MNQMTTITAASPVVALKDGRALTNSRDVAEFFGKRHDHVLRDIEGLIRTAPAISPNFGEVSSPSEAKTGPRFIRSFDMNKDGFTLLAMGFNGPKALQFKMAYIKAFNAAMGEILRLRSQPATDPALIELLRTVVETQRQQGEMIRVLMERMNAVPALPSPDAVERAAIAMLASRRLNFRDGETSAMALARHGFPIIKSMPTWFSHVLRAAGCGNGQVQAGSRLIHYFDCDKVDVWMGNPKNRARIERKIAARKGQGKLTLVGKAPGQS